jgi:uncharacterized protein with von Willebrand factor type A (vWA) domain
MKLAKRKSQPLSPQQQLASEISQLWSQQLQEVENNPEAFQERLRVLKSYLKDSGQNLHLSSSLFLDPDQLYQVFKNNDLLLQVNRRQLDQWLSQRPQSNNQEQLESWRVDGLNLWLSRLPQSPD